MCLCLGYHVSDVSKHKSHLSDTKHVNIGDRVNVYIEWMFTSEETVMSHPLHDQSVYLVSSVGISGIISRYIWYQVSHDIFKPGYPTSLSHFSYDNNTADFWVHHNYWYHMISLNLDTRPPSLTSRMTITQGIFECITIIAIWGIHWYHMYQGEFQCISMTSLHRRQWIISIQFFDIIIQYEHGNSQRLIINHYCSYRNV